ncbi:glycosyltransferase family 39 protein [Nocardioides panacisoli]|uniref:Glycosyltransferase RgtA/B/C/D-like domain-containing protein n=1 Tax=Nocardioides panacisoli TaxID=627624 RepID=A0ABP7IGZ3_9ACTN
MTTRSRRSGAVLDPALVFVLACTLFALHGTQGPLDRDLGVFLYGGEQVAHGVPSYVGIFNSVGPLSDAVPGLVVAAGDRLGIDPILATRVVYLALSAGCCAALYLLGRRTFRSRAAGFLAASVLACAATFTEFASDGPREKTLMLLLLLLALVWLLDRRWFLAGAATAAATLTWQPAFAVAVAAALVAVAVERGGRVRAFVGYVVGGLVPTGIAVAVFAADHALRPAIDGFLVINAGYTRQPSLLTDPALDVRLMWGGYAWTILPFLVGLAVLPLLLAVHWRGGGARRRALVVVLAAALASVGWLLVAMNGPPDLFDVLPFGALGFAGLVLLVAGALPEPGRLALVASCVATAMVATAVVAVATRTDELAAQRAVVDGVVGRLPPGATVLSVNAPDAMVLADRTNPTPWQVFNGSEDRFLNAHLPGGLSQYAAWVSQTQPDLVVLGDRNPEEWLHRVLRLQYVDLGTTGRWHWYASTGLGAPRLQALRATVAADRGLLPPPRSLQPGPT